MLRKTQRPAGTVWPRVWLLGLLLLLLGSAPRAQAQVTLQLIATQSGGASTVAGQGSIVQFILYLTGGTNLGAYTTRVSVDTGALSFVSNPSNPNSNPFTSTDAAFDTQLTPPANLVTTTGTTQSLNISFGALGNAINNAGLTTELGRFSVLVSSTAPIGSAALTVTDPVPVGTANGNPSSVQDADTRFSELNSVAGGNVIVTASPEPAQSASLGLLSLGLGGLLLRARLRRKNETS